MGRWFLHFVVEENHSGTWLNVGSKVLFHVFQILLCENVGSYSRIPGNLYFLNCPVWSDPCGSWTTLWQMMCLNRMEPLLPWSCYNVSDWFWRKLLEAVDVEFGLEGRNWFVWEKAIVHFKEKHKLFPYPSSSIFATRVYLCNFILSVLYLLRLSAMVCAMNVSLERTHRTEKNVEESYKWEDCKIKLS